MKKAEKLHVNKIAELGCVACFVQFGEWGTPGEIHHTRTKCGAAQRSGWLEVICLCVGHHRHDDKRAGKIAIHGNAGKRQFVEIYGSEESLMEVTLSSL